MLQLAGVSSRLERSARQDHVSRKCALGRNSYQAARVGAPDQATEARGCGVTAEGRERRCGFRRADSSGAAQGPYLELLQLAGCDYGDFDAIGPAGWRRGTLQRLYQQGVYLTVDEFKGRKPVIRGQVTVEVTPEVLRNSLASFHVPAQTGGSRGRGAPVLLDLDFIRGCGANACLVLEAQGGSQWQKAIWQTPGAGARARLLEFGCFGIPPVRWFSQVALSDAQLSPIFRWSERAMRWGSRLGGISLPRPMHIPLADPFPIALWMTEVLRSGGAPHLFTFPSSAVRLCQAAFDRGIDLEGAHFLLSGEPITAARLTTIRRTGAEVLPRYGSVDCGPMGYGCLAPEAPDDVHLLHDLHAMIQPQVSAHREDVLGQDPEPLFLSSLHPAAHPTQHKCWEKSSTCTLGG